MSEKSIKMLRQDVKCIDWFDGIGPFEPDTQNTTRRNEKIEMGITKAINLSPSTIESTEVNLCL